MSNSIVIEEDGWLYVQDPYEARAMDPVAQSYIWPLRIRTVDGERNWNLKPGAQVTHAQYSPVYLWKPNPYWEPLQIRLPDGGQTQCHKILTQPLKSPRGGPWRYYYGEWVNERTGKRKRAEVPSLPQSDSESA